LVQDNELNRLDRGKRRTQIKTVIQGENWGWGGGGPELNP